MPRTTKGHSPNWTNRTMWTGDNLDIMRGMNSESVDLIYLDPPFNSNRNYAAPIGSEAAGAAFKDTWTLDDVDLAWHGEIAEQHPALYAIIGAAREAHGTGMQSYLIMMGVRLLEMRRLLKPTGSIYLHCDPTASHYLKLLMDSVFEQANFRSEIVWRRSNAHNKLSRQYGPIHDVLLFYSKAKRFVFHPGRTPYTASYVEKSFPYADQRGRYQSNVLTGSGTRMGESGSPWRGYDPTPHGRHWAIPSRVWEKIEKPITASSVQNMLEVLDEAGMILPPRKVNGLPRYKQYLSSSNGIPYQDVWAFQPGTQGACWDSDIGIDEDVKWLDNEAERIGYPTQKPVGLLVRIIETSSNEGDTVLDPFCGCATACVAADRLNRQWVGIDLSPLAARLVRQRIQAEGPLLYDLTHRTDIPRRTDVGKLPDYRTQKHTLFGKQEGVCNGCGIAFPFRNFTVDHVIPRSRGGTDHPDNLQLLCAACNSQKGNRTQAELIATLRRNGIIV